MFKWNRLDKSAGKIKCERFRNQIFCTVKNWINMNWSVSKDVLDSRFIQSVYLYDFDKLSSLHYIVFHISFKDWSCIGYRYYLEGQHHDVKKCFHWNIICFPWILILKQLIHQFELIALMLKWSYYFQIIILTDYTYYHLFIYETEVKLTQKLKNSHFHQ